MRTTPDGLRAPRDSNAAGRSDDLAMQWVLDRLDPHPPDTDVARRPNRAHLLATERAALERVLDDGSRGHGQTLVVRGKSGFGKTTLLDHAASSTAGFHIARVCGVESEQDLS